MAPLVTDVALDDEDVYKPHCAVLMRIVIMVNYYDDDDVVIAKTLFFMMTCLQ